MRLDTDEAWTRGWGKADPSTFLPADHDEDVPDRVEDGLDLPQDEEDDPLEARGGRTPRQERGEV